MALAAVALAALLGVAACATAPACTQASCADDARITAEVRDEIADRPALNGTDSIGVQTIDGIVYLHGIVDTDNERELAESLARRVRGVRSVVGSITVRNAGAH
ncbi:MAG TPA: BON domain-containing protein [Dokdonella sp.]